MSSEEVKTPTTDGPTVPTTSEMAVQTAVTTVTTTTTTSEQNSAITSDISADVTEKISDFSESDEELQDALESALYPFQSLGNPWVENPSEDMFTSHRKLISYMRALDSMDGMLRDAGRKGRKLRQEVVEALFKYTEKAHLTLLPYIHKWIQDNEDHPALRKVQELISTYKGMDKVESYYRRALLEPEARSHSTLSSTSSNTHLLAKVERTA